MSLQASALFCLIAVSLAAAAPTSDIPQDVCYTLTGIEDQQEAVNHIKSLIGAESEDDVTQFLLQLRGSQSWDEVYSSLQSIQGSTQIKTFIDSLKAFSNDKAAVVVQRLSKLLGEQSILDFLVYSLEVTQKKTVADACADIRSLTTQNLDTLTFLEQMTALTRSPPSDLFKAVLSVTGLTSLKEGWIKHAEACGEWDVLTHTKRVAQYTAPPLLTYATILMKVGNGPTILKTCETLEKYIGTDSYFPAIDSMYKASGNTDLTDVLNAFDTISSKFDDIVTYLEEATGQNSLLKSMEFLTEKSGDSGFVQAIKNIKQDQKYYIKSS